MFIDRVAKTPRPRGVPEADGGRRLAVVHLEESYDEAQTIAAGLLSLGLAPEERVGIASNTRLEWIMCDLAVMLAGGATTTVYPSTGEEDVAYILADADVVILFAGTTARFRRCATPATSCPTCAR